MEGTEFSPINYNKNQTKENIKKLKQIRFQIQGSEHVVRTEDITPNTSLNSYLRKTLHLTGTKGMCFEGGCGACIVVLQKKDPLTDKQLFLAVNSCVTPLLSCHGWTIDTIETIGNLIDGFHPIQKVLAHFNGTQCGFCSPGMVMNMYALYESGKLTMEKVEDAFGGNLCRCTGYRPILTAFKSLCEDADPEVVGKCPDMEDVVLCQKKKCSSKCNKECLKTAQEAFYLELVDSKWVKLYSFQDLIETLKMNKQLNYRLVAGSTAQGVYPSYKDKVALYIDITDVSELKVKKRENGSCILGANLTLSEAIEFFTETSTFSEFSYLKKVAEHINLVANVPIRNRGTLAGNLMMKHDHHKFPSDIFLLLETVAATLTIVDINGQEVELSPLEFINHDMNCKILKNITLKSYPETVKFVSYKIMPRAQNTHAHVNSGFLFKFCEDDLLEKATIVYGNINPKFVHATQSEKLLQGKNLFDNTILHQVCSSLQKELNTDVKPPDASPQSRQQLALALFYKAVLSIAPPDKVSPKNRSGAEILKRSVSKGTQDFQTNESLYPLTQSVPKLEALAQTSGKAEYVIDMPDLPFQLFAALVLAKAPPNSIIQSIDATEALKNNSIVVFYTKDDIPGENNFCPLMPQVNRVEEIFCGGTVKYYEQPLGILVGKSQEAVNDATSLVKVIYKFPKEEAVTTIRQILKKGLSDKIEEFDVVKATHKGNDVKHVVKGTFDIYQQAHFHMETHCCNVVPTEDGLDVFSATQWIDFIQLGIAKMLNLPQSKINVVVRRCGGGFGGKITRAGLPACAAALASWLLKKPVKIWVPLKTNMAVFGKRFPFSSDYEVGVDDKGVIQHLDCVFYSDAGFKFNEDVSPLIKGAFFNIYDPDTFSIRFNWAMTDTPLNTWTRGPGTLEAIGCIESIIEHISYATGQDPLKVRLDNLPDGSPLAKYFDDIKSWANIEQRQAEITSFNEQNRWKKRGLAVVPMNFTMFMIGPYLVTVSIFHGDGSVQIRHGGVEIGQGINTKAAQVCAYKLGIPLEKITVLPSNSFSTANTMVTAASITSEAVCYGIIEACEQLLARIEPYRRDGSTWEEVIEESFKNFVSLVASGMCSPASPGIEDYDVYGICATEVLVDILTGQHLVTRVDLIEDAGVSMNPVIDIGQVEGAFIMGLGYYTTEKIVYNEQGRLLTNNTWTYLPPGAKDIPELFRVKFPKNTANSVGVLQSKATGEPAICLGITVPLAIRNALASARTDAGGLNTKWFPIDGSTDVENVILNTLNHYSQYVL